MKDKVVAAADAIRLRRYAGASIVFAAGSIVRGEGTPYSDLDLVAVYPALERAYRESFRFDGYPVEAFVHDPETLNYFFVELDRASGVPSLPQMVLEGVEIPGPSDLSRELKRRAAAVLDMGPPALSSEDERKLRYAISDLVDDLRAPRSHDELLGIGARLFEELANYYLRSNGLWSAKGKAIPRTLERANAGLHEEYAQSFETLFGLGDPEPVIKVAERILQAAGGFLFEGFRSDAPSTWRKAWRDGSA